MQIDARAGAVASAAVSALAYVLGAALHLVLPWGAPAVVSFLFRVDIMELAQDFNWLSFFAGVVMFAFFGAFFGYLGCWLYNRMADAGRKTA